MCEESKLDISAMLRRHEYRHQISILAKTLPQCPATTAVINAAEILLSTSATLEIKSIVGKSLVTSYNGKLVEISPEEVGSLMLLLTTPVHIVSKIAIVKASEINSALWECRAKLLSANLDLLLLFGELHSFCPLALLDICNECQTMLITGLPPSEMQDICSITCVYPVSDILDIVDDTYRSIVELEVVTIGRVLEQDAVVFNPEVISYGKNDRVSHVFLLLRNHNYVSVILASPIESQVAQMELEFTNMFSKLRSLYESKNALLGGGVVVRKFIKRLRQSQTRASDILATAFEEVLVTLLQNTKGLGFAQAMELLVKNDSNDVVLLDVYDSTLESVPTAIEILKSALRIIL